MIDRANPTTACPLDCPDACGVVVQRDAAGRLERLRGNPAHAWSRGSLCGKTSIYHELVHAPNRLRVPLIKRDDGFVEASWDEALDEIARRMGGIRGEDVLSLNYAGNMGLVQRSFPKRILHALGATETDGGVCDSTAEAGYRMVLGHVIGPDLAAELAPDRCDLLVLWGADARRTTPHLLPRVKELVEAGVPVYVVDVYRTDTVRAFEDWGGHGIVLHPGTDAALALGLIQRAFEQRAVDLEFLRDQCVGSAELRAEVTGAYPIERVAQITGLDAETITSLSDALHAATRPLIKTGVGWTRRRNGGMSMRAVTSLGAVLGHPDRVHFESGDHFDLDVDSVARPDLRPGPAPPEVSQVGLGRELVAGRFRAALVWGHNPAATLPDARRVRAGLSRDDLFLVVHELFMTETARLADVVLPATAVVEHSDVFKSYGHRVLQVGWRSCRAPGEQRSNVEAFAGIGRALGLDGEIWEVEEDWLVGEFLAANRARFTDAEYPRLLEGHPVQLAPRVLADRGTPSGKVELASDAAEALGQPRVASWVPDDGAGLEGAYGLHCAPSVATHNSTYLHSSRHARRAGAPCVWMHPDDASAEGLVEGERVRLVNVHGALTLPVKLGSEVARSMLRVDGFLDPESVPEGIGLNALTSPEPSDLGGGNVLYSARVDLERIRD